MELPFRSSRHLGTPGFVVSQICKAFAGTIKGAIAAPPPIDAVAA